MYKNYDELLDYLFFDEMVKRMKVYVYKKYNDKNYKSIKYIMNKKELKHFLYNKSFLYIPMMKNDYIFIDKYNTEKINLLYKDTYFNGEFIKDGVRYVFEDGLCIKIEDNDSIFSIDYNEDRKIKKEVIEYDRYKYSSLLRYISRYYYYSDNSDNYNVNVSSISGATFDQYVEKHIFNEKENKYVMKTSRGDYEEIVFIENGYLKKIKRCDYGELELFNYELSINIDDVKYTVKIYI